MDPGRLQCLRLVGSEESVTRTRTGRYVATPQSRYWLEADEPQLGVDTEDSCFYYAVREWQIPRSGDPVCLVWFSSYALPTFVDAGLRWASRNVFSSGVGSLCASTDKVFTIIDAVCIGGGGRPSRRARSSVVFASTYHWLAVVDAVWGPGFVGTMLGAQGDGHWKADICAVATVRRWRRSLRSLG